MTDIDVLRRDGIARVYPSLGAGQATELAAHLRAAPCYVGHVRVYGDGVPRSFAETAAMTDVWCHDMETVVLAPYVWDLAISLLPTAARYLGAQPRLYSMNAFWVRASEAVPRLGLQTFHRDHDDERFLALFVYGTDVLAEADGPPRFVLGSHDPDHLPIDCAPPVYGPAGTAFLADTRGLHMGVKPTSPEPRLILWARWGISERPWSYDNDRLEPVDARRLGGRYPADPATRDLVRLVAG